MTPRHRASSRVVADDRGSISLYFAIITLAALAMAGLVIDGGAALATRERAADLATQAARAGANALAPASLRGLPSGLVPNPAAAQAAATQVLRAGGASGHVVVEGDRVTVTATIHKHTVILSAIGLDDVSETASASATPVYGGTRPEGS